MLQDPGDAELKRLPGLFRRWELPQILEPGQSFRLEDAGTTSDGTALLAVYRGACTEEVATHRRAGRLDD